MKTNTVCAFFLAVLLSIDVVSGVVPSPSEMAAKVIVNGRTSTPVDIEIVPVGDEIPVTYSRDAIKNTPGFSWWVSRHYALKTDYGKDMAELYLTLLELSYPHYVELFGAEPVGIENTRMAAIYASSGKQLEVASLSDGMTWTYPGGGITYEGIYAAYQFQCYPVEFVWDQPRYILIHECAHLFQMCLNGTIGNTPGWYFEGVADRFSNHVYDSKKKQLTVNVFDKAGPLHFPETGLNAIRKSGLTLEELIEKGCVGDRGVGVVVCTFFNSTPDLMQRFRLWRDAMVRAGGGDACAMIEKCFGSWRKLNAEFKEWIDARQPTFWSEGRQWSQDGDTLWATASPPGSDGWSYKEVFLAPGEKPERDAWRLDHPGEELPSIVGPVRRGKKEPSVGCVVDLSKGPDAGCAGIGLGAVSETNVVKTGVEPGNLKLLVRADHTLVIDGQALGISNSTVAFPSDVTQAMIAAGHQAGITASIGRDALRITVRARDPMSEHGASFETSIPLSKRQRKRLLTRPLALLAQGGYHGVTHFFDPGRMPEPDLLTPAPANPGRNPGDKQLYSLYQAEWQLGDKTPKSLRKLKQLMLKAAEKDRPAQEKALALYDKRLAEIVREVRLCEAEPAIVQAAVADLTGLSLKLDIVAGAEPSEAIISAAVQGPRTGEVKGLITFESDILSTGLVSEPVVLNAGEKTVLRHTGRVEKAFAPFSVRVQAELDWRGEKIVLVDELIKNTSIPRWLTVGAFDNKGDGTVDTIHPPETEPFNPQKKYTGKDDKEIGWEKRERPADSSITSEFLLDFASIYGGDNVAAYAVTWICSPVETDAELALGSDDGVVVWLNDERVHSNMVSCGYSSKQDRTPIHLKAGRNKLLVKVAQGGGAWSLCAHILDQAGGLLDNITYGLSSIPAPSEIPAKIIVSGRTSTAIDIKMVKIGKEIPKTYAGDRIHNTEGFEFYVSQHYALKSNMGDEFSFHMLEISELAYPHWVELVGSEPSDLDTTRMYLVYGNSAELMNKAMADDVGSGAAGYGGGITIWNNHSAYNYQSGGLTYHKRDLVIHENLHMLNMVVNGTAGTENWTYGGSQHVYDRVKKQLTVQCFDAAPINHHTTYVGELQTNHVSMQTAIETMWGCGGGPGSVYHYFFLSDPDRWFKWCIWRDEFFLGKVNNDTNKALMEDIFGSLDVLDAQWQKWLSERRSTFHHVDWGWEQDGNIIWAYGFPGDGNYWSQMDIMYAPNETAEYDPLRMDYPAEPMPPIVGPVKRGVAEPSVGFVLSAVGGGCWAGFGLGVDGRSMCFVGIAGDQTLIIDGDKFGESLGIARQDIPLTEEIKEAAKSDGGRYGITMQIKKDTLEVTVRAGASTEAMKEMKASAPLSEVQRERLMSKHMTMVGKGGYPRFTPFFDDARKLPPDLTVSAPANKWRFPGEKELYRLYRTVWRLKDVAPQSLTELKEAMVAAVDKEPATQQAAMDLYHKNIRQVIGDVQTVPDPAKVSAAMAELLGVSLQLEVDPNASSNHVAVSATVQGRQNEVKGTIMLEVAPQGLLDAVPDAQTVQVAPGKTDKVQWVWGVLPDSMGVIEISVRAELECEGITIVLQDSKKANVRLSIPCWYVIGPFDNQGGAEADIVHAPENEPFDLSASYPGITTNDGPVTWQKCVRGPDVTIGSDFIVDFNSLYGSPSNVAAYAITWVDCSAEMDAVLAIGSEDGFVAWVNGERVGSLLKPARSYASQGDRVPIHLKAGENEIRLKITLTQYGWKFGAHIIDAAGDPVALNNLLKK